MTKRPNIVVFFTDQQRWDTCGCYNPELDLTPNLDGMAKDGVVFEHTYTCQPVCGPARVAIQSGMYPTAMNYHQNCSRLEPEKMTSIAQYLGRAGYKTAYFGKNHWSLTNDGPVPEDMRLGYKTWKAMDVLEFGSLPYEGQVFDENNERVRFDGKYRADFVTDLLIDYVKEQDGKEPFFAMMSVIEPHHQNCMNRYVAPDGYAERYKDAWVPEDLRCRKGQGDWEKSLPDYYGIIKRLDENLGRVIETLKEKGLYDDTVIIFTSDHGSHFRTRNGEYKRACHEACTRIPFVMRGPGMRKDTVEREHLFSLLDMPATILDIAGVKVPEHFHGASLLPYLSGGELGPWREDVFIQISESQIGRALCSGKYKYSVSDTVKDPVKYGRSDKYKEEFLYDLERDPAENENLIDRPGTEEIRKELRESLIRNIEKYEHYTPVIEEK